MCGSCRFCRNCVACSLLGVSRARSRIKSISSSARRRDVLSPPENLRRAMTEAKANEAKDAKEKDRAAIDVGDKRLSLHSLRHSAREYGASTLVKGAEWHLELREASDLSYEHPTLRER